MDLDEMGAHLPIIMIRGPAASDEAEERRLIGVPLAHTVASGRIGRFI
jgi:hypothetical protein